MQTVLASFIGNSILPAHLRKNMFHPSSRIVTVCHGKSHCFEVRNQILSTLRPSGVCRWASELKDAYWALRVALNRAAGIRGTENEPERAFGSPAFTLVGDLCRRPLFTQRVTMLRELKLNSLSVLCHHSLMSSGSRLARFSSLWRSFWFVFMFKHCLKCFY